MDTDLETSLRRYWESQPHLPEQIVVQCPNCHEPQRPSLVPEFGALSVLLGRRADFRCSCGWTVHVQSYAPDVAI